MIQTKDREIKKIGLNSLFQNCETPFHIETFSYHEDAVRVATSLFQLISQDFRIDKDKWKILYDNADCINMALLRQQQLRLSIIKAIQVFFNNQNVLRHILKQQIVSIGKLSHFDQFCPILSGLSNFVLYNIYSNLVHFIDFIQFCPICPFFPFCPILSYLVRFVNFVQYCPFFPISYDLTNFVLFLQFCPICSICPFSPILSDFLLSV